MRARQLVPLLLLSAATVVADKKHEGVDPDVLIHHILAVDSIERSVLHDVTFDAEYVERRENGSGRETEKARFIKKIYVRYEHDTARFHETYLEFYADGSQQNQDRLRQEAADRREEKRDRGSRDISYRMLTPFYPSSRERYDVEYLGLAEATVDDYVCHHFRVHAREAVDSLFDGDFYFESATFHLVRVDFRPARLVRTIMFRLNELKMSLVYAPFSDDIWLPRQFDVSGRGRAALFFGVKFSGTEYYRNPVVNSGLSDTLFAGVHND